MIFESFNIEFSLAMLKASGTALIIATAVAIVSIAVGHLLFRNFALGKKSVMKYDTLVSNTAFAGFPVIGSVFGDQGMFLSAFLRFPTEYLCGR